jgi:hypothetical protein
MAITRYAAGAALLLLALTGCGGGGAGGLLGGLGGGSNFQCDTGTREQLANPAPNQTGVPTNMGQITIVADGNANTLYSTYNQWNVVLQTGFGQQIQGGPLTLVSYPSGPHPYASDFYYASSIPALNPGTTYNVLLEQNNGLNCTAVPLNSFST